MPPMPPDRLPEPVHPNIKQLAAALGLTQTATRKRLMLAKVPRAPDAPLEEGGGRPLHRWDGAAAAAYLLSQAKEAEALAQRCRELAQICAADPILVLEAWGYRWEERRDHWMLSDRFGVRATVMKSGYPGGWVVSGISLDEGDSYGVEQGEEGKGLASKHLLSLLYSGYLYGLPERAKG